jgi:ABC-type bacteriocin/lantibiotic exporter with double-glycine peptidase domain
VLFQLLHAEGLHTLSVVLVALVLAAGGVVAEAVLLRSLFDLSRELELAGQRLGALGALLGFLTVLLLLEGPLVAGVLRLGRHLEARLRVAFFQKLPRLGDQYFQSRLTSDMAERSHSVHRLRLLPDLGSQLLRTTCTLVLTAAGLAWLAPTSTLLAALAAVCAVGVPLLAQPLLAERDLRVRSHAGALSRFYLDTLLGLGAIWAHGAERAVQRAQTAVLGEWARAGLGLQRAVVAVEVGQSLVGFGLAVWLVRAHLAHHGATGHVLLLVYWALALPVLGQEIALLLRQYPSHRNVTLRLLEPLGAPEGADAPTHGPGSPTPRLEAPSVPTRGVAIALEGVSVQAAGHTIL